MRSSVMLILATLLLLASSSSASLAFPRVPFHHTAMGMTNEQVMRKTDSQLWFEGFFDATMGWTYPNEYDSCSSKASQVRAYFPEFLGYMLDGNLAQMIDTFFALLTDWRAFPRCYYLTNVPFALGYTVLVELVGSIIEHNRGRHAYKEYEEFMTYIDGVVFGFATFMDMLVLVNDVIDLLTASKMDPTMKGEFVGSLVRLSLLASTLVNQ